MPHPGGNEGMSRREVERSQDGEVTNSLLAEELDQAPARSGHRAVYSSRHHSPEDCSML